MQEVSGMTLSEWQQRLREVQDSIKSHEDSRRKASSIIRVRYTYTSGTYFRFSEDNKHVTKA